MTNVATLPKTLPSSTSRHTQAASVAEAKANFSSIVRQVEQERSEVIVMRRGVAVAKIIPFEHPKAGSGFGWMKGTAIETGDIVGPTGEIWDVGVE